MRMVLVFLFYSISSYLFGQWGEPVIVNAGASTAYTSPRVVFSDVPVVVWGDRNGEIFVRRISTPKVDPISINKSGPLAFVTDWASTEVHAKGQNIMITFKEKDQTNGSTWVSLSRDGGRSFAFPVEVIKGDSVLHRFPYGVIGDEDFFISYMAFEPNFLEPHYKVIRLNSDLEHIKTYDISLGLGEEACDCCTSHLGYNEGRVILSFRNNKENVRDMHVSVLEDKEGEFTAPLDVNQALWEIFACPSTSSNVHVNGMKAIIAHISAHEGSRKMYLSMLDLSSQSIEVDRPLLVNPSERTSFDHIRKAGNQDTVGIVWQESSPGRSQVYFTYSDQGEPDLGLDVIRVSSDSLSRLVTPAITFQDGRFHFSWTNNSRGQVIYRAYRIQNSTSNKDPEGFSKIELFFDHDQQTIMFSEELENIKVNGIGGQIWLARKDFRKQISLTGIPTGIYVISGQDKFGRAHRFKRFLH